ncbi:hypothetical protein [Bacteroides cellulosilyticus]|nr:hypothetical protein [Bacteroides cellulosilyticus]MBV3733935.1 hypothetical protein [Bacteroides cellulosilyticus]
MRQICAAALTLALVVAASGCNTEDLSDTVRTLPDKQDGKMTIHAATGRQSATRVAYEDGTAGADGKLTWQTGDRLTVVRMNGSNYVAHADDYLYNGTDGATSGSFTGTAIPDAGDSWTIYYPHTVAVNTTDGSATLPMTGQTQTSDGNTDHLRNHLLLASTGITDLSNDFTLAMKNSIMKFDLNNVPAEVGKLTNLVWTVETTNGTRCLTLSFAPEAVTFNAGKRTLTAYLAFMPEEMAVKAGGKFTVTLTGDKTYQAETTIAGGKTYAAGMRYTAAIDGTSIGWEEKAVMALTVKVGSDDRAFSIPFPTSGSTPAELTVDWGDGTALTTVASGTTLSANDNFNHTYAAAGEYTIVITSGQKDKAQQQIPAINFFNNRMGNSNPDKLIRIDTPLLNTQATEFRFCFYECQSLSGIPAGLFDNNTQATDFYGCFNGCTSLQSIPAGLFEKNTLVTDFYGCFSGCTSLQSIPAGLFDKNTKATSFGGCFYGCTSLSGIPAGLFDNNAKATSFDACFNGCALSDIPANLFDNNTQATSFNNCFNGCALLRSIPKGLFDKNTKVTNFHSCFSGCALLQSLPDGLFANNTQATDFSGCIHGCTSLQSLPAGLFDKNTEATNFYNCFANCTSLQSLPTGLFDNNTLVTNFSSCFNGCTSLSGIPSGLFAKNTLVTNFGSCFSKCTSLSSIPAGLFEKNTLVTYFTSCFDGCTSLSGIPAGLFDNNTLVTHFNACFNGCTSVSSIPENLFDNNTQATNFTSCFYRCTSLSGIPAGLFDKNTLATNFNTCFVKCTSLSSIPAGLFDKNTEATSFSYCFSGCTSLVLNENIFSATNSHDRFSGKSMQLNNCFENVGSALSSGVSGGTAPDLWNYNKGDASWNTKNCFKGATHLSNYASIPTDWGGAASVP